MPIRKFPDPNQATEEGIVALGGDLHPESLLLAYRQGIFPWPVEGLPLAWFCLEKRAILEFSQIHLPRSLTRFLGKHPYRLSLNEDFGAVIESCADIPRAGQDGTWITPAMIDAYCELHELGHALSVEVWEKTPEGAEMLVGGIYGVEVDGCFAGESMFHLRPNASKLALLHLVEHLRKKGMEWMDIQTMTPHMERLGAREIPREEFLALLSRTQKAWRGRR